MAVNKRILYGIFIAAALVCFFLMITGCSKQETAEADPFEGMSRDLRMMQGSWEATDTNGYQECGAIIQDYTIRLRYKGNTNSPLLKQNASIDRLDERRNLLIINGGIGAWPYAYGLEDGKEHLKIEFFSNQEWNIIHMKRAES